MHIFFICWCNETRRNKTQMMKSKRNCLVIFPLNTQLMKHLPKGLPSTVSKTFKIYTCAFRETRTHINSRRFYPSRSFSINQFFLPPSFLVLTSATCYNPPELSPQRDPKPAENLPNLIYGTFLSH